MDKMLEYAYLFVFTMGTLVSAKENKR